MNYYLTVRHMQLDVGEWLERLSDAEKINPDEVRKFYLKMRVKYGAGKAMFSKCLEPYDLTIEEWTLQKVVR